MVGPSASGAMTDENLEKEKGMKDLYESKKLELITKLVCLTCHQCTVTTLLCFLLLFV